LSLPLSTQTFGVVPMLTPPANQYPPDQANRNLAAIYEASLTILSLLKRGQPTDLANALEIAQALDYALYHDNHGDPLPISPTNSSGCYGGARVNQCALHSAYQSGDIALLNNQPLPELGQAGDVRLAGFTGGCGTGGSTGFCLSLDGATGGNNAWAILALAAAYIQSGNTTYLSDAETIGYWVVANLLDPSQPPASFGGYFVGYNDDGLPKILIMGKSTENNADIFAAFSLLAQIEIALGNTAAAAQWTSAAKTAGDFVITMFDPTNGRFYAGTVTQASAQSPGPGVCPTNIVAGNDVINACDFLDSNSFTTLAMAGSQAYGGAISWGLPVQFLLSCPVATDAPDCFTQTVTAAGNTFQGFDIVPALPSTGVTWEFTGQTDETCSYLDAILNVTTFESCAQTYLQRILDAQNQAPFGDGMGIAASVLQNGDVVSPGNQCLMTPFQCIPERVGLAGTNWGIISDQVSNPLAFPGTSFSPPSVTFPSQSVGTSGSPQSFTLTSAGTSPLVITFVGMSGANAGDFQQQNTCQANSPLKPSAICTITVTFAPTFSGARTASLVVYDNAFGSSQSVALAGTGQPLDDFSLSVSPTSQSVVAGNFLGYTVNTAVMLGNPQSLFLSVSGVPSCATPSFSPNPINSGQSSILTITTGVTCAAGSSSLIVTGTGSEAVHTASATLIIDTSATLMPAALTFASQTISTSSAQRTVLLANGGGSALSIANVVLSGSFAGDFAQSNTCQTPVLPGGSCTIAVTFTPTGTGTRQAILYVFDASGSSPQSVTLAGTGVGSCASVTNCALSELSARVTANQKSFFVYQDADSAFNHGYPSIFFGSIPASSFVINAACVDDPTSANGCSTDPTRIDGTRGTVFSLAFPAMSGVQYGGVNFQDPANYGQNGVVGNAYDLTPATGVQFDVRSPNGVTVQFGAGGCVTNPLSIGPTWTTMTIPLDSLFPPPGSSTVCPPDVSNINILFTVTSNAAAAPTGGTVLLDNVLFTSTPARTSTTLSLPVSTQTFGVVAQQNYPIPFDQGVRNLSTTYESSLSLISLLRGGQASTAIASEIAQAMHYALYNDNHGDPMPISLTNPLGCFSGAAAPQCGLHSGYEAGDLSLFNNQPPPELGQAGDVRLSGFSAGTNLCGANGFCLVLDGATGANNAWAMLAFAAAYQQLGDATYLTDAQTIGKWIVGNLTDTSPVSYGGYFLGYNDGGLPKVLTLGKSTADNAVIFAAFNALAQIEAALGNSSFSAQWTSAANVAGDFVVKMFDAVNGRFYAGTLNSGSVGSAGPGVCPDLSLTAGNDVVNSCDFLDSDSSSTLAMAASPRYAGQIDWSGPLQYVLTCPLPNSASCFTQTATLDGASFQGFDLVPAASATGSAWEYTGQVTETCNYLDSLFGVTSFQNCFQNYDGQFLQVQNSAPFGDGMGLVASTLPNGDILPPLSQCLTTPFVCTPERVSLAATNLAFFADQGFNPFGPGYSLSAEQANPPSVNPGGSAVATVTVTSASGYTGRVTLACSISPVIVGASAPTCSLSPNPVSVTGSTAVSATLTFSTVGPSAVVVHQPTRAYALSQPVRATLRQSRQMPALWLPLPVLALIGLGFGYRGSRRKKLLGVFLLNIALTSLIVILACGGSSSSSCSTAPSVPAGLQASSTTSSGTTLNWSASVAGADCTFTGYTVYQNGAVIAAPTTDSYTVTGLSPSTTYSFTVSASDSAGTSAQSSPLSVTTLNATPSGTYTISITGKDANGITQNGGGATVTVKVVN
jgi:hypothetical protein